MLCTPCRYALRFWQKIRERGAGAWGNQSSASVEGMLILAMTTSAVMYCMVPMTCDKPLAASRAYFSSERPRDVQNVELGLFSKTFKDLVNMHLIVSCSWKSPAAHRQGMIFELLGPSSTSGPSRECTPKATKSKLEQRRTYVRSPP
jgi:hypothetical protein